MSRGLISVIIPVYNGEKYIAAAIDSVFAQSYKNVEVIIINDASTDGSEAAVRAFGDRVRYIPLAKNSGGPAKPRNIGLREARGEYVAVFDADDLMLPGKFEEQVSFLEKHPDVPLVFTDFRNFTDSGKQFPNFLADHADFHRMPKAEAGPGWYVLPAQESFEVLLMDNFVGTSGALFRRGLVEQVGGFDERMVNSDDLMFWLQISAKFPLGFIDKVYHRRRIHGSNISSKLSAYYDCLQIYEWLEKGRFPLSRRARANARAQMSEILYTIGNRERLEGRSWVAARHFLKSWSRNPSNWRILRSVARCVVPF